MNSIGMNTAVSTACHYSDVPCMERRRGYQETELTFISRDCMVASNNDVQITDDMQLGIKLAAYFSSLHKVDEILKKFA